MTPIQKGVTVAVVQLALVASLGAKYALDRAWLPRVWTQTVAYDPDLPIRGRYLTARLKVDAANVYGNTPLPKANRFSFWGDLRDVKLSVESGHLVATPAEHPTGLQVARWTNNRGEEVTALSEPVAFFMSEHATDPSWRKPGEELWIEVTVPKKGPPRPIRLAVKRGETFTPLDFK
jgi:hypothetical protein